MNKTAYILTGLILSFLFSPHASAVSKPMEGHMEALNCLDNSIKCLIDYNDPHINLVEDFVILMDNGEHFLMPNVPWEVKARYIGKTIKVWGQISKRYKAITVDILMIKNDGDYEIVWPKTIEKDKWWEMWKKDFYEGNTIN